MFQEKITFKNSLGLQLAGVLEGESKNSPLIILCHGFDSSKNSESNAKLAAELVKRSLSVFRFDFTGNGESAGKLEDLTPLQGLDDLKSAISFLSAKDFGLYGGSFGGNVALLYSTTNPLKALALRAPVSDYLLMLAGRAPSERRKRWAKELADTDIYKEARNISAPVLIVHGDADEEVPIEQSKKLFASLAGEKRLEALRGCSHQFRGEHLEKSNTLIADFFQEHLLTNKSPSHY